MSRRDRGTSLGTVAAVVLLAGLIFALHGQALGLGLFMDDHVHFRQLRECGWSPADLTEACRLELIGGTIELWWLPDVTLRFFRPVAFGLMKLTYTLSGWSPTALHAASLLWHLLTCTLLLILLKRCGASTWLAWALAGLFAIHPAHVATVQWIACQTELMVTSFLLGATLCFGRFRGWPGFGAAASVGSTTETTMTPGTSSRGIGWAVASVVLFALALGCRENAVMFPFVVATVEPLVWRRRRRGVFVLYAVFGLLLLAYVALRSNLLGGAALPPRPYVFPPSDPEFPRYVFDKAWYCLLGQFLMVPCVPIAGIPYCREHPLLFYSLSAGVGLLLLAVCITSYRRSPGLIGPAWLIGFMVPLLPVFASPHHLYLPGVGWAVILMFLLRKLGTPGPLTRVSVNTVGGAGLRARQYGPLAAAEGRPTSLPTFLTPTPLTRTGIRTVRRVAMWSVIILVGAAFARATTWLGLTIKTAHQVEHCLVEEIAAAPSGLEDGDTLYVANLPLIGHYARPALEERTGRRNLRVIPLTWAPRILGPVTPAELIWIDERTIEMRVAEDRYFAGPFATVVREVTGQPIPDHVDCSEEYGFRVVVLERDADGIRALRFIFERPLSEPGIHLFWGSRVRWAYEVPPREHR